MTPRVWMVALGLLTGCGPAPVGSESREPVHVRQPGFFRDSPVSESSGVTVSQTMPGHFWTLNDSGNEPSLFSFDSTATPVGFVDVAGARNVDWEAISSGPCGPAHCLYIADIGDNGAARRSVTIYRVIEPTPEDLQAHHAVVLDSLVVRYSEGPRDAESLVVAPDGRLAIITKGREGSVTAFGIEPEAWSAGHAIAKPIWTLPISPSILTNRLVTDAALSPDGQTLAVRTYRQLFMFRRSDPSRWLPDQPAGVCDLAGLEPQGEGIAWATPTTLVLTSEILARSPAPVTLLECPAN